MVQAVMLHFRRLLVYTFSTIGVMSVTRETSRGDFTADHECSLTQFCHYATLAYKAHKVKYSLSFLCMTLYYDCRLLMMVDWQRNT